MRSSLASRLCAIGALLSPDERLLAARITQPVLLAHGQLDRRVAASDAASLYQAIRQGNPNAEWLRYDDEGQGLTLPGNRIDFWRKVEQFLARHNAPR